MSLMIYRIIAADQKREKLLVHTLRYAYLVGSNSRQVVDFYNSFAFIVDGFAVFCVISKS